MTNQVDDGSLAKQEPTGAGDTPQLEPPQLIPPRIDSKTLDQSLISGLAWTGGVKWGAQIFTWVSTLVVARLLTPDDYGLVGMATLFLGLVDLVSEFGISTAVVKFRDLNGRQIAQLNTLAVVIGTAGFGIAALAAHPLGAFFGAPKLPGVVMVTGITFILNSFRSVPEALLRRELRFRLVALMGGARAVFSAVAALSMAWVGFGYWALVLANVVGVAVYMTLVLRWRRHPFAAPRLKEIHEALSMSGDVLGARLAWYAYSNADFLVVGKLLGQTALGVYSIGWSVATIPINKITALVGSVTPPVFSAVQDQPEQTRRYLLNITEALALIGFPATVGVGLVAGDFVRVILGDQWLPAIWPLRLLAFYATLRTVQPLLPQVLMIIGESRFNMHLSAVSAVVLPAAFVFVSRFGITAVAGAWLILDPVLVFPSLIRLRRTIHMPVRQYLMALRPAVTGCIVMSAVVLAASVAGQSAPAPARLAVQVILGAGAYGATVYFVFGERIAALRSALATARAHGREVRAT